MSRSPLLAVLMTVGACIPLCACKGVREVQQQPVLTGLTTAQLQAFESPLKDRTLAPQISSYQKNPVGALGSVFVMKARPGHDCNSSATDGFTFDRVLEPPIKDDCRAQSSGGSEIRSLKVKGGRSVELGYFVGKTAALNEYAFDLFISDPISAHLENTGKCLDEAAIAKIRLPERTCEVRYITGVVLTQITWRSYSNVKKDSTNAFSAINLGGTVYYNKDDVQTRSLLTVDTLTLAPFFSRVGEFLGNAPKVKLVKTDGQQGINVQATDKRFAVDLEKDRVRDIVNAQPWFLETK